jgi:hypothetical protein
VLVRSHISSGSLSTGPRWDPVLQPACRFVLDPELRPAVDEPVAIENAGLSEVMREALRRDLKTECGPCLYPLQNRSLMRAAAPL